MIRDLLEAQSASVKTATAQAQARALRLTISKLRDVRKELVSLDLGTWGWAERTAVMVRLQAAVSQLSKGQVDLLAAGLGTTARVSARDASTWLHALDRQYLGVARPLRFESLTWLDTQAKQLSKVRLHQYAKSFAAYGQKTVTAIEDEIAKTILTGEPWTKARKKVWQATTNVVGDRQWMVDRILRTETSAAYNGMQLNALIEEDNDDEPMLKRLVATFDGRTGYDSVGLHGQTVPVRKPFTDPYFGHTYMAPPNRPHDREIVVGWRASYGDDLDTDDEGYIAATATPAKTGAPTPPGYDGSPKTLLGTREAILSSELRKYRRQLQVAKKASASLVGAEAQQLAANRVQGLVARIEAIKAEQDELTQLTALLKQKAAIVAKQKAKKAAQKAAKAAKVAKHEQLMKAQAQAKAQKLKLQALNKQKAAEEAAAKAKAAQLKAAKAKATKEQKALLAKKEHEAKVAKAKTKAPVEVDSAGGPYTQKFAKDDWAAGSKKMKPYAQLEPGDVVTTKSGNVVIVESFPANGKISLKTLSGKTAQAPLKGLKGGPTQVLYLDEAPLTGKVLRIKDKKKLDALKAEKKQELHKQIEDVEAQLEKSGGSFPAIDTAKKQLDKIGDDLHKLGFSTEAPDELTSVLTKTKYQLEDAYDDPKLKVGGGAQLKPGDTVYSKGTPHVVDEVSEWDGVFDGVKTTKGDYLDLSDIDGSAAGVVIYKPKPAMTTAQAKQKATDLIDEVFEAGTEIEIFDALPKVKALLTDAGFSLQGKKAQAILKQYDDKFAAHVAKAEAPKPTPATTTAKQSAQATELLGKETLSPTEAAKLFEVKPYVLNDAIYSGKLKAAKIPHPKKKNAIAWEVESEDMLDWLQHHAPKKKTIGPALQKYIDDAAGLEAKAAAPKYPKPTKGPDGMQKPKAAKPKPKAVPEPEPKAKPAKKAAPKPEPEPAAPPAQVVVDVDSKEWKQVGGQGGSNDGAMYQNVDTGEKWYVKTPSTEDIARNEVLAAQLYREAGVDVPEVVLGTRKGKPAIASKVIDGLESNAAKLKAGEVTGASEGFVVDAWLGNWDVVGLDYDNMLIKGAKALRLDTGGALRYRAQGGKKGKAFGDEVTELETMRDASMSPQAASVFGNVTDTQIAHGIDRVLDIPAKAIDDLVTKLGPKNKVEAAALRKTLEARRAYLKNLRETKYKSIPAKAAPKPAAVKKPKPKPKKKSEVIEGPVLDMPSDADLKLQAQQVLDGDVMEDWVSADSDFSLTHDRQTVDRRNNELLARELYDLTGIHATKAQAGDGTKIVYEVISDVKPDAVLDAGVSDGFVTDAWLANWTGHKRLRKAGGKVYRTDMKGALRYRDEGQAKAAAFGDEVGELDKFLSGDQKASYAGVNSKHIVEGIDRVAQVTDKQITILVDKLGPADLVERAKLRDTLIARRENLKARRSEFLAKWETEKVEAIAKAKAAKKAAVAAEKAAKKAAKEAEKKLAAIKKAKEKEDKLKAKLAKEANKKSLAAASKAAKEKARRAKGMAAAIKRAKKKQATALARLQEKLGHLEGEGAAAITQLRNMENTLKRQVEAYELMNDAQKARYDRALGVEELAGVDFVEGRAFPKGKRVKASDYREDGYDPHLLERRAEMEPWIEETLTHKEKRAISRWSGADYGQMRALDSGLFFDKHFLNYNGTLDLDEIVEYRELLAHMRSAYKTAPATEATLMRGVTFDNDITADLLEAYTTVGKEIVHDSLASWSHGITAARSFAGSTKGSLVLRLKTKRGIPIDDPVDRGKRLSGFGDRETEVMLDRGIRYRVEHVEPDPTSKTRRIVTLAEID